MFDDESPGEVEDLDGVAGVEDADPLESEGAADAELDAAELDRPAGPDDFHSDVVGELREARCGVAGRGGLTTGVAAQAWAGVIRPGSAWWGRLML